MVKLTIDLVEAETNFGELIQKVECGFEILILRDGQPVAQLLPVRKAAPDRVPGSAKGLFTVPDDFDVPIDDFRD